MLHNLLDLDVANLLIRERVRLAAKAALAAEAVRAEKTIRARHAEPSVPTSPPTALTTHSDRAALTTHSDPAAAARRFPFERWFLVWNWR